MYLRDVGERHAVHRAGDAGHLQEGPQARRRPPDRWL